MKNAGWLWLLLFCSCIHYRLNEKTGDAEVKLTRVRASGLQDWVENNPCPQTKTDLMNVRFTTNWGYALLSSVTLGFVNLVNIEYSCAPQTGIEPMPVCPP